MSKMLVCMALLAAATLAVAIEEPAYEVIGRFDAVEIRQYAPYAVAEVLVEAPADEAGNQAFPILAAYIFGNNKDSARLAMTAPVIQARTPGTAEPAVSLPLRSGGDGYLVQFVLPKGLSTQSAPLPKDERVRVRDVGPIQVAVIVYSGRWTTGNYEEHLAKLVAALAERGIPWKGEPAYARYNPPFTPWFMRRNEIWLALDSSEGRATATIH